MELNRAEVAYKSDHRPEKKEQPRESLPVKLERGTKTAKNDKVLHAVPSRLMRQRGDGLASKLDSGLVKLMALLKKVRPHG